jgi:hypothetical protein
VPTPDSLRIAVEAVHQAISDHPDAQSKQMLGQCLQTLLKIQALDYERLKSAGPQAALLSQMGRG